MQPLDPTLNVPSVPGIDIPSIPYKQLPFPFADLTNIPQPDHTQVYPDNIPPTVAAVTGMHPTNNQSQTVNTDGNHALLVSDVNASGGGGTPMPMVFGALDSPSNPAPGSTSDIEVVPPNATIIYGFMGYWYLDPTNTIWPMSGWINFTVWQHGGPNGYSIYNDGVFINSLTSPDIKSGRFVYMLPTPCNISQSQLYTSPAVFNGTLFNNTNGWIYGSMTSIIGPAVF